MQRLWIKVAADVQSGKCSMKNFKFRDPSYNWITAEIIMYSKSNSKNFKFSSVGVSMIYGTSYGILPYGGSPTLFSFIMATVFTQCKMSHPLTEATVQSETLSLTDHTTASNKVTDISSLYFLLTSVVFILSNWKYTLQTNLAFLSQLSNRSCSIDWYVDLLVNHVLHSPLTWPSLSIFQVNMWLPSLW